MDEEIAFKLFRETISNSLQVEGFREENADRISREIALNIHSSNNEQEHLKDIQSIIDVLELYHDFLSD